MPARTFEGEGRGVGRLKAAIAVAPGAMKVFTS